MRNVRNRLYGLFEILAARLVDHQGEDNGRGEAENQLQEGDNQGIGHDASKVIGIKEFPEVGLDTELVTVSDFDSCYLPSARGGRGYSASVGIPARLLLPYCLAVAFLLTEFV